MMFYTETMMLSATFTKTNPIGSILMNVYCLLNRPEIVQLAQLIDFIYDEVPVKDEDLQGLAIAYVGLLGPANSALYIFTFRAVIVDEY